MMSSELIETIQHHAPNVAIICLATTIGVYLLNKLLEAWKTLALGSSRARQSTPSLEALKNKNEDVKRTPGGELQRTHV